MKTIGPALAFWLLSLPVLAAPSLEDIRSGAAWDGRWQATTTKATAEGLPEGVLAPYEVLPRIDEYLQPWAAAEHKRWVHMNDEVGIMQKAVQNRCLPHNMPGERQESRLALNIVATPGVWMLTGRGFNHRFIRIGGEHPKDLRPSWLGDSVGHWEGDTLVVDTVGFNGEGMLEDGVRHTEQLHMTARYRLITLQGKRAIQALYTYDDPGSTTKTLKFARVLVEANDTVDQEAACNENNKSH
jgi:hypothetical protein